MGKNKLSMSKIKGFTLIELLVSMIVLGVMASFFLMNFPRAQMRSRDVQRKSDLDKYAAALERYANDNEGYYPRVNNAVPAHGQLCSDLGLSDCPSDPRDGENSCRGVCRYFYQSDGVSAGPGVPIYISATAYTLRSRIEEFSTSGVDGSCPASHSIFWVVCSGGVRGYYCGRDVDFSNGVCPL